MNLKPVYLSKNDVLDRAKTANGHCIGEFNINSRNLSDGNKGVIGQIVEEGVFGYSVNNRAEPDFEKLGLELKVTGLKCLKNNCYVAKERLVLNIIDYFYEGESDFEHSSFWLKNSNLLLMFYLYQDSLSPEEFRIIDSIIYSYPMEDLKIIKDDWQYIKQKIVLGEAHLLSEADTMYLAACCKGPNGEYKRIQPYSNLKAKQRAFCLKSSYLNHIIKKYCVNEKCEKMMSISDLENNTFEMAVSSVFNKYKGRSESYLRKEFNINSKAKNYFELLASKMIGLKGKINNSDEFVKANIIAKTIRIEEDGRIVESMSFPHFDFKELVKEEWKSSTLRNMFYETKFMFIVFKKHNGEYIFSHVKFWNMPVDLLEKYVKEVWMKTKTILLKGNVVSDVKELANGKFIMQTNFPGMKFNGVCHVRPHARNSEDTLDLPVTDLETGLKSYTKQCFWLNNTFIRKVVD